MGLLVRVHGGAMLAQNDQYGILNSRGVTEKHHSEKTEIAERALAYIRPGDIVALDGGSTTLEMAKRLDNQPLTVVTNDLFIIAELPKRSKCDWLCLAGLMFGKCWRGRKRHAFLFAS